MEQQGPARSGITPESELLAQMADGLVVVDPAGVVCFANPAAYRLFGHARDEGMIGRLFGVPVVASGVAEIELVSGNTVRLIELNASRISWGTTPAWLIVMRDVTVRRERELSVFRKGQDFEQFAYTVSHDLQEPLRTIEQLAIAYLEDHASAPPDEGQRQVHLMRDIASKGRELVRALIDYAALGAGAQTRVPCDLSAVLQDALANLGAELEQTGAHVCAEGALPTLVANRVYLVQVLQNLIGNALKFGRASVTPLITVRATKRQVDWRVDVCDNGLGVPEDQADYVFGMFAQLTSSDAALGGKGLGLAVCKKIVEYHGGSIWIDTAYSDGCKVSFTLPHAELSAA